AELRTKSIRSLIDHLKIGEILGAAGLIFHLGSGKGIEKSEAIDYTVSGMKEVLKNSTNGFLIMENSAGGGSKLGGTIEDVEEIFKKSDSERVKVCFDTAHAYEAGIIDR